MTHNEKVLLIAALLLAHGSAVKAVPVSPVTLTTNSLSATAATATFTSGFSQPNANSSYYFAFDTPIDDASALTSISAGSLSGGEAGTFTLSVNYESGGSANLFSSPYNYFTGTSDITFSGQIFQPFATGNISGFTFNISQLTGFLPTLDIPAGSVFTFAVTPPITPAVPEPSSVLLMLAGGAAGLLSLRRRRKSAAPQLATSE